MPNWLILVLVLVAVVPGAVIILAGVFAMFMMPRDAGDGPATNGAGEAPAPTGEIDAT